MKVVIIVFPGSNCDRDVAVAISKCTPAKTIMHWHGDPDLPRADSIVIPGGFSYGDYLRPGSLAAHSPVIRQIIKKAKGGTPVLGICNGFQILTECGLLPGTLMRNIKLKFICRNINLSVENTQSIFTNGYVCKQTIKMPIAHNEGNYYATLDTLNRLEDNDQIAFRYCTQQGEINAVVNPNGAAKNIAGILNKNQNVLGLMPHPERCADHALGGTDGKILFSSLIKGLTGHLCA